jgi:hypothetical protein
MNSASVMLTLAASPSYEHSRIDDTTRLQTVFTCLNSLLETDTSLENGLNYELNKYSLFVFQTDVFISAAEPEPNLTLSSAQISNGRILLVRAKLAAASSQLLNAASSSVVLGRLSSDAGAVLAACLSSLPSVGPSRSQWVRRELNAVVDGVRARYFDLRNAKNAVQSRSNDPLQNLPSLGDIGSMWRAVETKTDSYVQRLLENDEIEAGEVDMRNTLDVIADAVKLHAPPVFGIISGIVQPKSGVTADRDERMSSAMLLLLGIARLGSQKRSTHWALLMGIVMFSLRAPPSVRDFFTGLRVSVTKTTVYNFLDDKANTAEDRIRRHFARNDNYTRAGTIYSDNIDSTISRAFARLDAGPSDNHGMVSGFLEMLEQFDDFSGVIPQWHCTSRGRFFGHSFGVVVPGAQCATSPKYFLSRNDFGRRSPDTTQVHEVTGRPMIVCYSGLTFVHFRTQHELVTLGTPLVDITDDVMSPISPCSRSELFRRIMSTAWEREYSAAVISNNGLRDYRRTENGEVKKHDNTDVEEQIKPSANCPRAAKSRGMATVERIIASQRR